MEQRLAACYQKLGRQIAAMIPAAWEEVHYLGEVEPGRASWSSVFYFREPGGAGWMNSNDIPRSYGISKPAYMAGWMKLNEIMLEAYDCFAENGREPWEQMTFSLDRGGKFRVDFNYHVMSPQDGGQLTRQVVWASRTFGYAPEKEPMKSLLEKYG